MGERNEKGVTLIELVVVLVIIAIGAVLIAPNIGAWLPNYRLRSATRDIVSTMRTAHIKAVSTNTQYRVNFTANSFVLQRNSGGLWPDEGGLQALPAGIAISSNLLPDAKAVFNTDSTSSAGSVTLSNSKGATRTITLTPATGRVTHN